MIAPENSLYAYRINMLVQFCGAIYSLPVLLRGANY